TSAALQEADIDRGICLQNSELRQREVLVLGHQIVQRQNHDTLRKLVLVPLSKQYFTLRRIEAVSVGTQKQSQARTNGFASAKFLLDNPTRGSVDGLDFGFRYGLVPGIDDCKQFTIRRRGAAGNSFLASEVQCVRTCRLAIGSSKREHRPAVHYIQGSDDIVAGRQNSIAPMYLFREMEDHLSLCESRRRDRHADHKQKAPNEHELLQGPDFKVKKHCHYR